MDRYGYNLDQLGERIAKLEGKITEGHKRIKELEAAVQAYRRKRLEEEAAELKEVK